MGNKSSRASGDESNKKQRKYKKNQKALKSKQPRSRSNTGKYTQIYI